MFSKYSFKIKLVSRVFAVVSSTGVVGYLLINMFIQTVKVEELKPITSKTIAIERKKTESATIGVLVKVTEAVKSSEAVNLNFQLTTEKGEDLLVLINKKISLPESFVPSGLVSLESLVTSYPGAQLKSEAANALKEMFEAAKLEKNMTFTVVSSYRSYKDQVKVFNGWVFSAGLKSAESFSARPGHSQHQLGTAVDIGVPGVASFSEALGSSAEGVWLVENAYRFGYTLSYPKGKEKITGYSYEPWHYRYIGKDNAKRMMDLGLILEEFLQKYGTW